jgi:hypothetical protein
MYEMQTNSIPKIESETLQSNLQRARDARLALAAHVMGAIVQREGSTLVYLDAAKYACQAVGVADRLLDELRHSERKTPVAASEGEK